MTQHRRAYHVTELVHCNFVAQTLGVVRVDELQVTLPDIEAVHLFLVGLVLFVVLGFPFQPLGLRASGGQHNANGNDKELHH